MPRTHVYRSQLSWDGSTAAGYDAYSRAHTVALPPSGAELSLSADTAFRGDRERANPEQLLLAAASSCQLLTFLAIAARAGVEVLAYQDDAEALMPEDSAPMRITRITLRPRITVAPGADRDRVARMAERAHRGCFVANTLSTELVLHPQVVVAGATPSG